MPLAPVVVNFLNGWVNTSSGSAPPVVGIRPLITMQAYITRKTDMRM